MKSKRLSTYHRHILRQVLKSLELAQGQRDALEDGIDEDSGDENGTVVGSLDQASSVLSHFLSTH